MAEDAKRYHRLQLILGMLGLAVTGAYFVVILFAGLGPRVARWAGGLSDALAWRVAAVAAAIAIGQALVTFPLAWLRGYWLPRRHGLLHQTLGAWLRDRLKAALIGGALGLLSARRVFDRFRPAAYYERQRDKRIALQGSLQNLSAVARQMSPRLSAFQVLKTSVFKERASCGRILEQAGGVRRTLAASRRGFSISGTRGIRCAGPARHERCD